MMGWMGDLLRRARIRGLVEGKVQRGRAEATEHDAKDDAERWQDYGFTAQPVDGQGLVLNWAGHTIVLRMDRIAERPQLAAYEVSVWHREGHRVTLKAGKVVQVDCDELVINAAMRTEINSPSVTVNASSGVALNTPMVSASEGLDVGADAAIGGSATAATDVVGGGISLKSHPHPNIRRGTETSDPPI
jgi:phage baseplate assembly protein V